MAISMDSLLQWLPKELKRIAQFQYLILDQVFNIHIMLIYLETWVAFQLLLAMIVAILTNFPVKIPQVSKFRDVLCEAKFRNLLHSSCGTYILRKPLTGVETLNKKKMLKEL